MSTGSSERERRFLGSYIILGVTKSLENCSKIYATLHTKDGVAIKLKETKSNLDYFNQRNVGLVIFAIAEEYRGILASDVTSFSINQECDSKTINGNILFILPPPLKN